MLYILGIFSLIFALTPLLLSKYWWIRGFDFPHVQFTCFSFLAIVFFLININSLETGEWVMFVLLVGIFIYQLKIIAPYTPFSRKQVMDALYLDTQSTVRIFTSNVFQDNHDFEKFISEFKDNGPDLAILLETDQWWVDNLSVLKEDYPYHIEYPLDNYYGIALYSKLPTRNLEVKFLISDEIPSIHGEAQLRNGVWVKIFCLHPMPPSPTENEKSLDRDAELLLVAKSIDKKDYPLIVMGDMNDVAWSHTTRMFQRISRLLDPRIGRGFYNTFHAKYPFMRWPLDHLFVSNDFQLVDLRVLKDVGSDHFPVTATLCYNCLTEGNNKPPKPDEDDLAEAEKTIEEGLEENGKEAEDV